MAYTFVVGYTPIAPSTWDTNQNGGTINSTFFPRTANANLDLTPLPANFKLTQLWTYLNVSGSHNTTIDLGVIDVNTGTNSTKPLLYSASVALNTGSGTGWMWVGNDNLNIDFSSHANKRLAAASGRPLDGQRVQFRYATTTGNTGGWVASSRGANYTLPNPWPSGQAAHYVSLYAVFTPINSYIEASGLGKPMTLTTENVGKPITIVPF